MLQLSISLGHVYRTTLLLAYAFSVKLVLILTELKFISEPYGGVRAAAAPI